MSGVCNCGLLDFGKQVLRRMKELGMIADLAHASIPLMDDILNLEDSDRKLFHSWDDLLDNVRR